MDIPKILLSCRKASIAAVLLTGAFAGSVNATPTNAKHSVPLHKADQSKPATKLEIISAVKKVYSGRILSVRKGYKAYGTDCHNVRLIDKSGELLVIHVGCS